jgi:hypothetical protein
MALRHEHRMESESSVRLRLLQMLLSDLSNRSAEEIEEARRPHPKTLGNRAPLPYGSLNRMAAAQSSIRHAHVCVTRVSVTGLPSS